MKKNKKLFFGLILVLFLIFRIPGLGSDLSNTDAYRWHKRSQNFLTALKSGDFKSTYQHYQPGITLMWLNAFVKQASFTTQHRIMKIEEPRTLENADWYPVIHGLSKLAVVLVLAAVFLLQLSVIEKLFNLEAALFYGFFISVEPYLIGIDRWFHLTSLETYFSFASFLLLLYWHKCGKLKDLVFSGILFSVSVLSKITTILTLPVFLMIFKQKGIKQNLKAMVIFAISALITVVVLFPAVGADPLYVFGKIFTAGKNAVAQNYRNEQLTPLNRVLFYDLVLIFKLSPIVIAAFLGFFTRIKEVLKNEYLKAVLFYLLIYYFFLTVSQQKIDRYAIVMFPGIIFLAAHFISLQSNRVKRVFVLAGAAYIAVVSIIYYPIYSAYNSPLLGGTKTVMKLGTYDNSGEYFADAANYLNTKGRDAKVYVPHGEASFVYYFKGKKVNKLEDKPDFIVSSYDLMRKEINNYGCENLEKSFGSRESDIVFVFGCN